MLNSKKIEKEQVESNSTGAFVGFVLLSENRWNTDVIIKNLKKKWKIKVKKDDVSEENILISIGGTTLVIGLMPAPIPNNEAEENAANNFMWKDAIEVTKTHQAHILVSVIGDEMDILERGKLFVKAIASCCKLDNAIGVFTSGTVFEPNFYFDFAELMKRDHLPVYNWIWFGLYNTEEGVCCYTYGMKIFGKDEMEVLNASGHPSEVREFLVSMATYVLENDVELHDGETIGFSANDIHSITKSEGVSLPEATIKISY